MAFQLCATCSLWLSVMFSIHMSTKAVLWTILNLKGGVVV